MTEAHVRNTENVIILMNVLEKFPKDTRRRLTHEAIRRELGKSVSKMRPSDKPETANTPSRTSSATGEGGLKQKMRRAGQTHGRQNGAVMKFRVKESESVRETVVFFVSARGRGPRSIGAIRTAHVDNVVGKRLRGRGRAGTACDASNRGVEVI